MHIVVDVIPGRDLTAAQIMRWREIQASSASLASPYFCPEFTQAVAAVRNDVFVAVIHRDQEIIAYFPFQRGKLGLAAPVGGNLSDFHGLIATEPLALDAKTLLQRCGLGSYAFHHVLAEQAPFAGASDKIDESHLIDLTEGFSGYEAALRANGSKLMRDFHSKCRKLEREFGAVRFEAHSTDSGLLERLISWKSAQYESAGLINVFGFAWTRELLRRIHSMQTPDFAGMLSVLRVDGEVAAIHMGMRSRTVWNWWFPRHDERFAKGSPGLILRLFAAQHAPEIGVKRIDLGLGGRDTYKPRLSTGSIPLASGRISRASVGIALLRAYERLEHTVRRSPLMPIVRIPGRWLKRLQQRLRFQ